VHLLEKLGLMVPVGAWVLKEACTQMRSWNEQFADLDHLFVSVNLGARQIAQEGFADTVAAALDESGLPPEHLVVDITEDALRFNKSETWNPVRGVKFLGVRAALDDFGTGESGMTYLRELQVDFLTIHRQFLEGLGQVEEDTAIIRSMVELGRELGIATIAEGIETTEQARLIKEIGPDYLQGYYYGRPELPETTEALLADGPTIEGSEDWKMAYSGMAPPPDEDAAEEGPPDEGASFS
jgi:EAL domain-containing protein (putative c-di-GMP-specific phosphodiesterase class I)